MSKETIAIIDYGSGNLRSAAKAFEHVIVENQLDASVIVTDKAELVAKADYIVLPGQGAFQDCMTGLRHVDGMIDALNDAVHQKARPFLGICVGMQLMAARGLEHGECEGLNWIDGDVIAMQPNDKSLKIPHMGWNIVETTESGKNHPVLQSITKKSDQAPCYFYFVHSFMFQCKEDNHNLAGTDYGGSVTAIIGKDNMLGVQFHPEKSQESGLQLLKEFVLWKP